MIIFFSFDNWWKAFMLLCLYNAACVCVCVYNDFVIHSHYMNYLYMKNEINKTKQNEKTQ